VIRKRLVLGMFALLANLAWAGPIALNAYGNFQQMMQRADLSGKVSLAALDTGPGQWGMGALADLKGELVQFDGKLLVTMGSEPEGLTRPANASDSAVLWVGGKVAQWAPIELSSNMGQAQFESFVKEQAAARKIDLEQPFFFRVSGAYSHLVWHVVNGENPSSSHSAHEPGMRHGSHANQQSGMRVFRHPQARGQLLGVYSGAKLEGVVSHPGERFHVHYLGEEKAASGHVDQYSVLAGSTLWISLK